MTQPGPETLEREKDKLYITDAELIHWLGVPAREAREWNEFPILNRRPQMTESGANPTKALS